MMNNIKKYLKIFILWLAGGFSYFFLEILFRGRSHWTMCLLGGFCFLLIGALNEYLDKGWTIVNHESNEFVHTYILGMPLTWLKEKEGDVNVE